MRVRARAGWRAFDVRDSTASEAALRAVLPHATNLTLYMCWHEGEGHGYPAHVMQAARRLRERQTESSSSDDSYTSLMLTPSPEDVEDVTAVAPFCDLAYATDAGDEVIWEVSGEGPSGSVRERLPLGPRGF